MDTPTPSPGALRLTLVVGFAVGVGVIGALRVGGAEPSEPPAAAAPATPSTERPSVSVVLTVPAPAPPGIDPPAATSEFPLPESDTIPDSAGLPTTTPTAAPPSAPPPEAAPKVILYGDSLAFGAKEYFEWIVRTRGWEPVFRVFPGSATCDWIDELEQDLVDHAPKIVVVAFSGNAFTECMVDPVTEAGFSGDRHTEKYRADTSYFARSITDAGAFAVVVGAPAAAHGGGASLPGVFREIVGSTPGSLYVDGGATIAPGGVYTPTMPCRPDEGEGLGCVDGMIRVRADDGAHFCPAEPLDVYGTCPVYASGAHRYAELMASYVWVS